MHSIRSAKKNQKDKKIHVQCIVSTQHSIVVHPIRERLTHPTSLVQIEHVTSHHVRRNQKNESVTALMQYPGNPFRVLTAVATETKASIRRHSTTGDGTAQPPPVYEPPYNDISK